MAKPNAYDLIGAEKRDLKPSFPRKRESSQRHA